MILRIAKGHVGKDHVRLFVSVVSKVMPYLNGKTSHKLLMEFVHLRSTILAQTFVGKGVLRSEQR